MKRILVSSVTAAATTTVTVPVSGTIREVVMSIVTAAAGTWELSRSSTSQIATAVPDVSVLARARIGATAGNMAVQYQLNAPVKILDNLYIHTTGAGNVGEVNIRVD